MKTGDKALRVLETRYGGIRYRSRAEARWAVFFDMIGLRHQYEPEGFEVRVGYYCPDFWLPDLRMFFEVKGTEPAPDEIGKCEALAEAAECDVLLSSGPPDASFSLLWFDRRGQRAGRYVIALDRNPRAGFWLVGEEDMGRECQFVGPASNVLRTGPVFSGATDEAYCEARTCRFSGDERGRPFTRLDHGFGGSRAEAEDHAA